MQVSPGDTQAAGCQRFVPVVLANGLHRQFDFVIANLPLEGTCGMVIANIDDVFDFGVIVFLRAQRQIFHADVRSGGHNDCPLHHIFEFAHVAGPGIACQHGHCIRLNALHRLLKYLRIVA